MRSDKSLLSLLPLITIALVCASLPLGAVPLRAQTDIDVFWAKFKAAIGKKNRENAASLSKFPVEMPYGVKSVKTRVEFQRRFAEIFDGEADAAQCFRRSAPQKVSAKLYEVACGFKTDATGDSGESIIYRFELTKTGWKFAGLDNINE